MSTTEKIDWSKCDDVESVPGRVSGAWVIKGTRVQADAIVENARAGCTAEEIAGPDIPRASPSTSSSACCASPRSHRPRTDEDPARRKRSKRFAPHTRRPRRAHCTRNGLGPLLQRAVTRRSRKSRFRSAHQGDRSLPYQQNLTGRNIAVIIFSTNAWPIIRTQPQTVQRAVANVSPGTFTFATFHRPRRSRRPPAPTC